MISSARRVSWSASDEPPRSHFLIARMATTGIYLLRGVPRDLQRASRIRSVREGTALRWVLLQGLREYAAGTWTPRREHPRVLGERSP